MSTTRTPPEPSELTENLEVLRDNLRTVRDAAIAIGQEGDNLSMECQSFATAVDRELELVQTALDTGTGEPTHVGDDERVVAWSSTPRNLRAIKAEAPDELVDRIEERVGDDLQQWG